MQEDTQTKGSFPPQNQRIHFFYALRMKLDNQDIKAKTPHKKAIKKYAQKHFLMKSKG